MSSVTSFRFASDGRFKMMVGRFIGAGFRFGAGVLRPLMGLLLLLLLLGPSRAKEQVPQI